MSKNERVRDLLEILREQRRQVYSQSFSKVIAKVDTSIQKRLSNAYYQAVDEVEDREMEKFSTRFNEFSITALDSIFESSVNFAGSEFMPSPSNIMDAIEIAEAAVRRNTIAPVELTKEQKDISHTKNRILGIIKQKGIWVNFRDGMVIDNDKTVEAYLFDVDYPDFFSRLRMSGSHLHETVFLSTSRNTCVLWFREQISPISSATYYAFTCADLVHSWLNRAYKGLTIPKREKAIGWWATA